MKNRRLLYERAFHNRWASQIDDDAIDVMVAFEGSTAPENRFILSSIGDVRGKYILDLGCGAGENSVYFSHKGARCVATDWSPAMVEVARRLAARYSVDIRTRTMNATEIDFADETFDIVYASNLLHHVDTDAALKEIHRVLKTGGLACMWDPLKHNPVINIYRRIAKDVRSSHEHPLDINIVERIKAMFTEVKYDTFWLVTLWIFLRFFLIEGVNPNRERYWKKIMYEEPRLRNNYLQLEKLDRRLKKIPFLKRYAWNIAIVARK